MPTIYDLVLSDPRVQEYLRQQQLAQFEGMIGQGESPSMTQTRPRFATQEGRISNMYPLPPQRGRAASILEGIAEMLSGASAGWGSPGGQAVFEGVQRKKKQREEELQRALGLRQEQTRYETSLGMEQEKLTSEEETRRLSRTLAQRGEERAAKSEIRAERESQQSRMDRLINRKIELAMAGQTDARFSPEERAYDTNLPEMLPRDITRRAIKTETSNPDTGESKLELTDPETGRVIFSRVLTPASPITTRLRELAPEQATAELAQTKASTYRLMHPVTGGGGGGGGDEGDIWRAMSGGWRPTEEQSRLIRANVANDIDPALTPFLSADKDEPEQVNYANQVHGALFDILNNRVTYSKAALGDIAAEAYQNMQTRMASYLANKGNSAKVQMMIHGGDINRPFGLGGIPEGTSVNMNPARAAVHVARKAAEIYRQELDALRKENATAIKARLKPRRRR